MITTLLFDADGVVQTSAKSFISDIKSLVPADQSDEFIQQVFAAEAPPARGEGDFLVNLQVLLKQWQVVQSIEEVLRIWHQIEIVPGMTELLAELRGRGYRVCLATNQQANRMMHMRHSMKLDDHFDQAFYSCEIGASKPTPEYFEKVLGRLEVEPGQVLFVDDNLGNIEGAKICGLNVEHFCVAGKVDPIAELSLALKPYLETSAAG